MMDDEGEGHHKFIIHPTLCTNYTFDTFDTFDNLSQI